MPKMTNSNTKQPTYNPNHHSRQPHSPRPYHSPQNYPSQSQNQDQSYHQSTPIRSNNKPHPSNSISNRQHTNRPPKYDNINLANDQSRNKNAQKISRIREENIDIKPHKQSRIKEKASHSKPAQSDPKPSKEIGKLSAQIRYNPQDLEEQPSANTPEERKIRDLHANMEKLSESLLDLRENYEYLQKQQIKYSNLKNSSHIYDSKSKKVDNNKMHHSPVNQSQSPHQKARQNSEEVLSKSKAAPKTNEQILKFLLEKQREKEQRKKKMAIISQQNRKKLQEQLLQRQQQEHQYLYWRQSQIRAAHNYEQKHKREKEIEQSRKKAAEQYAQQIKDKKYRYLLKQQQLQEQKQKEFEENREKVISERKELFKPLNLEEIEEHEKWFYAKREELLEQKRMVRKDQIERVEEDNSNLPEFWKGSAHQIAEEQRRRAKQKLKQPSQKAQKIKEYKEYIQQKFKPKSPKQAQPNSLNIFDPSKFREVKRYRYYKGVSYGQIAQTAPVAKDAKQIIRIGNSNMEIMKKIPKKRKSNSSLQMYSYTPQPERKYDLNLVRNIFSSVVQKEKAKSPKVQLPQNLKCEELDAVVDKIRSQSVMLYDKEKYLSREGNKNGRNRQQQQELVDGLVSNIELKLNLLSQL